MSSFTDLNIERFLNAKVNKGKNTSGLKRAKQHGYTGAKSRRANQYTNQILLKERRKSEKVDHRKLAITVRYVECEDIKDEALDNIHFANFLQCEQFTAEQIKYNSESPVNIGNPMSNDSDTDNLCDDLLSIQCQGFPEYIQLEEWDFDEEGVPHHFWN